MSVVVRPAGPADAAWLAALAERTFRETYSAENTPENMERYVTEHFGPARQEAELRDPRMSTLVAEVDGQAAGYAQLARSEPPAPVTRPAPVEIVRFYVDRPWHGQGVAQTLMPPRPPRRRARVVRGRSGSASGSGTSARSPSIARAVSRTWAPRRSCWAPITSATLCSPVRSTERHDTPRGPTMASPPMDLLLWNLQPAPGRKNWHGGPSPVGALRGVDGRSRPRGGRRPGGRASGSSRSISPTGSTRCAGTWRRASSPGSRGAPPTFPACPIQPDERAWASDVALLRTEHDRLVEAVRAFPARRLGAVPPGGKRWTYGEIVLGIAAHDAYHTGQIQLLKRLWQERATLDRGRSRG